MAAKPEQFSLSIILCFTVISLLLRYLVASYRLCLDRHGNHGEDKLQRPPVLPHAIPFLGSIPWSLVWKPLSFAHTYSAFWKRQPVRLRFLFTDIYLIQGSRHQAALLKQASLSVFFMHRSFLVNVFRLPKPAAALYSQDDSGGNAKPHAASAVEPRNRVEHHLFTSHNRLLMGPGQASLIQRFIRNARLRLSCMGVAEDAWTHIPDFMTIFKSHLTAAAIDTLAGPALIARHPHFAHDLWAVDHGIMLLLFRVPRFLSPAAHGARDRLVDAVLDWHAWARDNFTPGSIDADGNDPFWGMSFFRERQRIFSNMDGFDSRALASEDLAFFWSAQVNGIISAFWLALETFRDAALLHAVRQEVQSCISRDPDGRLRLDTLALTRQPLLQAMFAETLRLRVHGFILRYPHHADLCDDQWRIPRNNLCVSNITPLSMDPEFWAHQPGGAHYPGGPNMTPLSKDPGGASNITPLSKDIGGAHHPGVSNITSLSKDPGAAHHPVHEFWPGRFLKRHAETNQLLFCLPDTPGFWMPFGASPHLCPGRVYAKRQNLTTLALLVTLYDCDILAPSQRLVMDSRAFPRGVVPPRYKTPARMRRTKTVIDSCV